MLGDPDVQIVRMAGIVSAICTAEDVRPKGQCAAPAKSLDFARDERTWYPVRSIPPDEPCQPALDADLIGPVALRLVVAVGRVEADHAAFVAEGLQRRLAVVDQGDDDLAIASGIDLANEREVAVENAFLDHRIPDTSSA